MEVQTSLIPSGQVGVYTQLPPLHPPALPPMAWALLQQNGVTARPDQAYVFSL